MSWKPTTRTAKRCGTGSTSRTARCSATYGTRIGHFYWYRLVENTELIEEFRVLFGDERADYAAALAAHYEHASMESWQESFVSSYASAHPWEDFAETWAHYIHIVDTLDAANDAQLSLAGRTVSAPLPLLVERPFAAMLGDWLPLTVALNQLNRSMGMRDAYPFALTARVVDKLTFVHRVCLDATARAHESSRTSPRGLHGDHRLAWSHLLIPSGGCALYEKAPLLENRCGRNTGYCCRRSAGAAGARRGPSFADDALRPDHEITVTGVVTEYQLGNPHMRIYLDVDNNGTTEKWLAEGGSRTQLMRVGWTGRKWSPATR